MSNLVPFKPPSREVQIHLDKLASAEELGWGYNDLTEKLMSCERSLLNNSERITAAEKLVAELEPYRAQLAAVTRPATKTDVSLQAATLVACYPTHNRDEAFVRILIADILETSPAIGAVDAMCRHLRHTMKFLPSIAEALEILHRADRRIKQFHGALAELPKKITQAKEHTIKLEALQQQEREQREREINQLLEAWTHGCEPCPLPPRDIVAEARKRQKAGARARQPDDDTS